MKEADTGKFYREDRKYLFGVGPSKKPAGPSKSLAGRSNDLSTLPYTYRCFNPAPPYPCVICCWLWAQDSVFLIVYGSRVVKG